MIEKCIPADLRNLNNFMARLKQLLHEGTEVARLFSMHCFGEQALINTQPRAATVKCVKETYLGVLNKRDYMDTLQQLQVKKQNEKIEFMKQCPYFKNMSRVALSKNQYYWKEKAFYKGQVLYRQGSRADRVFIIMQGDFEQFIDFKEEDKDEQVPYKSLTGPEQLRE